MDNVREKLVALLDDVLDECDSMCSGCGDCRYFPMQSCVSHKQADRLLANGVTVGGVAELISSSKIGLDWYTRIPIYYCSHCGWYIESRSKPLERPRDLVFCPKCGFMFLPQKEVNDGDDLDAGHG